MLVVKSIVKTVNPMPITAAGGIRNSMRKYLRPKPSCGRPFRARDLVNQAIVLFLGLSPKTLRFHPVEG